MKKLLILTIASFHLSAAETQPSVTWKQSPSSANALLEQVETLKGRMADVETLTRLSYQLDYDIQPDHVVETVTSIDYYPSFVDTEDYGSKSIYFDKHDQRVEILSAFTLTADGKISKVDPSTTKLLDTHSESTFTDQKQLLIPLSGLNKGSVSVLEYRIIYQRDAKAPHWAQQIYTQRSYPIQSYTLTGRWTAQEAIQWRANTKDIVCEDLYNGMHCKGGDIPAYKGDNSIYWRDEIGRVEISDFSQWQQVINKANTAMAKAQNDTRGVDDIYQHLTQNTTNLHQKISNLLEFVARDIRYVSMSEAEHSITPHTVQQTLANRYGDCKDKSTLLQALLSKAGIESHLVLVDTDRTNQQSLMLPAMNHFNHVVVCFSLDTEKYCLDPTDKVTDWQTTPNWVQGKASLALAEGQQPEKLDASLYRWRLDNKVTLDFNAQGGQTEHQKRTYWGEYAAYYRQKLMARTKAEQQEFLASEYEDLISDLAIPEFSLDNPEQMSNSLFIYSNAQFKPFIDPDQAVLDYYENDAWLMHELDSMQLSNQWHSEYFSGIDVSSTYEFNLENSPWKLKYTPSDLVFEHKYGWMKRSVEKSEDGKLTVHTDVKIKAQHVPAAELKSFNQFITILYNHAQIRFTGVKRK